MKKVTLLSLLAGFIALMSCGSDDEGPKLGLTLDETLYRNFNSYYDDYGTTYYGPQFREDGEIFIEDTHRRFEIMLTDGIIGEEACWPEEYEYRLNLALYSPSTDEDLFMGEYEIEVYESCCEDRTDEAFGTVRGSFEETPNYSYAGAAGTITFSGTFPNNLTAVVDLDFYYWDNTPARVESIPTTFVPLQGTFKGSLVERCIGD